MFAALGALFSSIFGGGAAAAGGAAAGGAASGAAASGGAAAGGAAASGASGATGILGNIFGGGGASSSGGGLSGLMGSFGQGAGIGKSPPIDPGLGAAVSNLAASTANASQANSAFGVKLDGLTGAFIPDTQAVAQAKEAAAPLTPADAGKQLKEGLKYYGLDTEGLRKALGQGGEPVAETGDGTAAKTEKVVNSASDNNSDIAKLLQNIFQ